MKSRSPMVLFSVRSVVAVLLLTAAGCRKQFGGGASGKAKPLLCYVGGTMRPAMEKIAAEYTAETGRPVLIDYAGSGELLIKIRTTRKGDLYVCHTPFGAAIMREGLADRVWTLASMGPVIVVPKGNPKNIRGVRDLTRPGVRLILTHAQYSTTGHICKVIFRRAGISDTITRNIVSRTRGGGAAANAVVLGTADAAIVWSAVAWLRRDKLDVVPIEPEFRPQRDVDAVTSATYGRIEMDYVRVMMALLKCSRQRKAAEEFAAFVLSEKGRAVFAQFGFSPADPNRPAPGETPPRPATGGGPALLVHCGAGLRKPVAAILELFTKQTGIRTDANYSGSNVLLSQIELTRKGDVYIPGDADYVAMARKKGLVAEDRPFCRFEPAILVKQGNPKQIRGVPDLARPGVRVGLGDEKACAIGRLTAKILKRNGMASDALKKNLVLSTMTANELAVAVKLGTVDAVIVWRAVGAMYLDSCEIVRIPPAKNVIVPVRVALLKTSSVPDEARKLLGFLGSAQAADILRRHHYQVEAPR
ncbi:MAG: solute-binding protein [Kiritimatiellaeota bacterium]|nr:solute-binding protein [Kiritimatiellota bacterium]